MYTVHGKRQNETNGEVDWEIGMRHWKRNRQREIEGEDVEAKIERENETKETMRERKSGRISDLVYSLLLMMPNRH